jgi:hypothetical protein
MRKIIAGLVFIMITVSCGPSSRIINSWNPNNIQPRKYKMIMVLGLINIPDRTLREKMEEHIAGDLKDLGYNAVCSCDEFDPKSFEDMTEKQALDKLTGSGIDAVLSVVLLDKVRERNYVPESVYYSPYFIYHDSFWGYYRTMYGRVYAPGYYAVSTKYFWESNFYSLDEKQLLYSAQSQSFDPVSAQALGHDYGQMIAKDMVKKNVLVNLSKQKPTEKPM